MADLGHRDATGTLGKNGMSPYGDGHWVVTFDPRIFAVSTGEFEVYQYTLKGPVGSQYEIYIDNVFYNVSQHGDVDSWNPNHPMHLIGGGQTVYFYFNSSAAPAPTVALRIREA